MLHISSCLKKAKDLLLGEGSSQGQGASQLTAEVDITVVGAGIHEDPLYQERWVQGHRAMLLENGIKDLVVEEFPQSFPVRVKIRAISDQKAYCLGIVDKHCEESVALVYAEAYSLFLLPDKERFGRYTVIEAEADNGPYGGYFGLGLWWADSKKTLSDVIRKEVGAALQGLLPKGLDVEKLKKKRNPSGKALVQLGFLSSCSEEVSRWLSDICLAEIEKIGAFVARYSQERVIEEVVFSGAFIEDLRHLKLHQTGQTGFSKLKEIMREKSPALNVKELSLEDALLRMQAYFKDSSAEEWGEAVYESWKHN